MGYAPTKLTERFEAVGDLEGGRGRMSVTADTFDEAASDFLGFGGVTCDVYRLLFRGSSLAGSPKLVSRLVR